MKNKGGLNHQPAQFLSLIHIFEKKRNEQTVLFIVAIESVATSCQKHTIAGIQETNIILSVPFNLVTAEIFCLVVIAADALIGSCLLYTS